MDIFGDIEKYYHSFLQSSFYQWAEKHLWFVILFFLSLIAWLGYYIRTRNLVHLIDSTTGIYIPADPDAVGIFRYVQYVVEHGQLMSVDYLRYYPTGFSGLEEFALLSHLIAWFYKIFHFFVPTVSVAYADVVYPAFAFVVALVFFFLFVQKAFHWKIALCASAFLAVVPAYITRTISGVSDKEAMAMIFFFLTLYLFLSFILEKKNWKSFLFVLGAALSGSALWFLWGGFVFVFLTIGAFVLLLVFLERISLRQLFLYMIFFILPLFLLKIFYPERYDFWGLVMTPAIGVLFFALLLGFIHYFLFVKDFFSLRSKISFPPIFFSLGAVFLLGIIWLAFYFGPFELWNRVAYTFSDFLHPFSATRWSVTVSENQQPYFLEWISNFGWEYLFAALLGGILLFYETVKALAWRVYILLSAYIFMILGISLSRYSPESIFNGTTFLSQVFFVGGFLVFFCYLSFLLFQLYKKDKGLYQTFLSQLSLPSLFILILYFFLLLGAHSAYRLLFVFAPITAILLAYFIFTLFSRFREIQNRSLYIFSLVVVILLASSLFVSSSQTILTMAESAGPGYNGQWQYAMTWVRENTDEDAVFAQWWDYGYYIQTFGERATLSDGGNAMPAINYFIGRYLFTGQSDTEVLEFLAAKNTTHVLTLSADIDKYVPISSIGSDANFDRLSWLEAFVFDGSKTQETRNGSMVVYSNIIALDEDLIIDNKVYPAYTTAIDALFVPMDLDVNGTLLSIGQPEIEIYTAQEIRVLTLSCVYYDGEKILFEESDIEGCVFIIPSYDGVRFSPAGAAIYISSRTLDSWFVRYYLFSENSDYFKEVYSDVDMTPLMYYYGTVIGPLKIWEVHYPENLSIPEEYYGAVVPEGVDDLGDLPLY